uniref:RNA-dependent RNA polymerase n=1 Tax=Beihai goldsaddle goatfish picobirnavirus TaxID=2116425 RepID=A0A2P1GN24_9VIRU|nr:RNA-dependent RNA polymerase [Beihai goldsaddle goatfish picobirnavirus]
MSSEYNISVPDLGRYFFLPNPGLRTFLYKNETGVLQDVRTPFWNKAPREEVVRAWSIIFNKHSSMLHDDLVQLEIEQSDKIGRFSCMFPFNERFSDVESYYTLVGDYSLEGSQYYHDIRTALDTVKRNETCRPGSIRLDFDIHSMKLNTNSGCPYFTRRNRVVKETLEEASHVLLNPHELSNYPCILGWRGQPVDKQRVVWMYPFTVNFLEGRYYRPRVKEIQKSNSNPAFIGPDAVDVRITDLLTRKDSGQLVVSTDFTKFDQHFNGILQDLSWELKYHFLSPKNRTPFEHKLHYNKFKIPIICTNKVMFEGKHGMSSGSTGTNQDENEAHSVMQNTAALLNRSELSPHSTRLGDDGVLSYPGITVENVTEVYTKCFYQEMNLEKQYASNKSTRYLQKLYSLEYMVGGLCVGVYPTFRALGRLLGQERFYDAKLWGPDQVCLRAMSILENCKHHPLFEIFVRFVISGDRYKLGILIPGFLDRIGKIKSIEQFELISAFSSYSRNLEFDHNGIGIKDWSVYKLLLKIRDEMRAGV